MMAPRYPRPSVIDSLRTRHAVIEASAGTGKTFTIAHLVVDLVLAGTPLEAILVVTFTEKATRELRLRVRTLLERLLAIAEGREPAPAVGDEPSWCLDDVARARLRAAALAFDGAAIYTIHGFCQRVLQEHAFETGELFEQERVDGRRLFARAFRVALRRHLAVAPTERALLERWLAADDVDALEELLFEAHKKGFLGQRARERAELPDELTALAHALAHSTFRAELDKAAIGPGSRDAAVAAVVSLANALREPLPSTPDDAALRLVEVLAVDLHALLRPRRAKRGVPYPDGLSTASREVYDRLEALSLRGDRAFDDEIVTAFLPLVTAELERRKRQDGQLDFDDMLRRLAATLAGPRGESLTTALRRRHQVALIDEFQDTCDLQWSIFRRLFVESAGPHHRLVVIGDPKQAIYAFRGADVHAYLAARGELVAGGAAVLHLDRCFRSSPAMVSIVNSLFDPQADPPLFSGDIRYERPVASARPSMHTLRPDGTEAPALRLLASDGASVRLLLDRYGRWIAETLAQLIDPEIGLRRADAGEAATPIRPSEVFCLTRTRAEGTLLAKHLRGAGVPFAFYKQEGLFRTGEAAALRDVLAAIVDPDDPAQRLRAFATPFFGASLEDLPALRAPKRESTVLAELRAWHALGVAGRLCELFEAIVAESGVVARSLLLTGSDEQLATIEHVIELLIEEGLQRRLGLDELVAALDGWIAGATSPTAPGADLQRQDTERDAVQIMTHHKAKGLEADVVVIYGGFSRAAERDRLVSFHDGLGRRRLLLGRAQRERVRERLARGRDEEEERLTYVATTRARRQLIVPLVENAEVAGCHRHLNRRLLAMARELGRNGQNDAIDLRIRIERGAPVADRRDGDAIAVALGDWEPPAALLADPVVTCDFDRLRVDHAPFVFTSYSALRRDDPSPGTKTPIAGDTPRGPIFGQVVHDVLERIDLGLAARAPTLAEWCVDPTVTRIVEAACRAHRQGDTTRDEARALVHRALTTPLRVGDATIPSLGQVRCRREIELFFPLPPANPLGTAPHGDPAHPEPVEGERLSQRNEQPRPRGERGFVRGTIDLLFEHEGRIFFADWKTDQLADYAPAAVRTHAEAKYALQAEVYTIGIAKHLAIDDAAGWERFGGFLYLFLRGLGSHEGAGGLYFHRPTWDDVMASAGALGSREIALAGSAR